MGESRYTDGQADKYGPVMGLFSDGIYFDQPDVKVTDEAAVQSKVTRFRNSTKSSYEFTPAGLANVRRPHGAVQLEFFVEGGVGKVRITNNCTVAGYRRKGDTWDYKIVAGSGGDTYEKYDIYSYHYKPDDQASVTVPVEDTYVTQTFAGEESEPGGQIFVDGDVVIGSEDYDQMVVGGKLTVVATGNIWVADAVVVDGPHDGGTALPLSDNPNVLGLIATGVIKVLDPGLSSYPKGRPNGYPGPPAATVPCRIDPSRTHSYRAVANGTGSDRYLPDPMVVEAAVTVGGGGWGAENVMRTWTLGGRKEADGATDVLIVRGTISEAVRAVVGVVDRDGYIKRYYLDARLLEGVLPGDIWFGGKFIPAPAGWHDYRPDN